jgi:hypothetical protein
MRNMADNLFEAPVTEADDVRGTYTTEDRLVAHARSAPHAALSRSYVAVNDLGHGGKGERQPCNVNLVKAARPTGDRKDQSDWWLQLPQVNAPCSPKSKQVEKWSQPQGCMSPALKGKSVRDHALWSSHAALEPSQLLWFHLGGGQIADGYRRGSCRAGELRQDRFVALRDAVKGCTLAEKGTEKRTEYMLMYVAGGPGWDTSTPSHVWR